MNILQRCTTAKSTLMNYLASIWYLYRFQNITKTKSILFYFLAIIINN